MGGHRGGASENRSFGTSLWRFCSAIHGCAHFQKPHPDSPFQTVKGQMVKNRRVWFSWQAKQLAMLFVVFRIFLDQLTE